MGVFEPIRTLGRVLLNALRIRKADVLEVRCDPLVIFERASPRAYSGAPLIRNEMKVFEGPAVVVLEPDPKTGSVARAFTISGITPPAAINVSDEVHPPYSKFGRHPGFTLRGKDDSGHPVTWKLNS